MSQPLYAPAPQRLKLWHAIVAFFVIGLAAQVTSVLAAVASLLIVAARQKAAGLPPSTDPQLPWWGIALAVLGSAIVLVVGSLLTSLLARVPIRRALGLRSPPPLVYLLACVAAIAASPVGGLFVSIAKTLAPGFTLGTMEAVNQQVAAIPIWAGIPVFALLPGISEETFFRGLLQRTIQRPWLAIALSGSVFAAYHVDPHHVAGTLPLGLLLAWMAWRADSVLIAIAGHASFNLLAVVLQHVVDKEPEDPKLTAASVGIAAAGAIIALACAWAITRVTPRPVPPGAPSLPPRPET